jgi:RHS repeat-associated protein
MPQITVDAPGYVYIFVANESENTKVWFDDLNIVHQKSNVVAGADYYPFGLAMNTREITREDYRYGYQGQFSEKDLTTGMQEFELRNYDARIGRWTTVDPFGQYASPYVGMGNAPQMNSDPTGGWSAGCPPACPEGVVAASTAGSSIGTAIDKGALQAVVVYGKAINTVNIELPRLVKAATWVAKDIGNFLTSHRVLDEIEKGLFGATDRVASFNKGASPGFYPQWRGRSYGNFEKAGNALFVLEAIEGMNGGNMSPNSEPVFATQNGNAPTLRPEITVTAPTTTLGRYGELNAGGEIDHGEPVPKGFKETKEFGRPHGQGVYQRGERFISRDIGQKDGTSHLGGVWKEFKRVGNRLKRTGTLDRNLNRIGD